METPACHGGCHARGEELLTAKLFLVVISKVSRAKKGRSRRVVRYVSCAGQAEDAERHPDVLSLGKKVSNHCIIT